MTAHLAVADAAVWQRTVGSAEQHDLAVELVHQPEGHHAFDVADDTDASREVIRPVLGFLRSRLGT